MICKESGVVGKVLRFYVPTASEEQTMILTDDGREYHAPTSTWCKITEMQSIFIGGGRSSCELAFSELLSTERSKYLNKGGVLK